MFGSGVLDTVIGLIFVFLLVSMLVTIANEIIASALLSRAKWLRFGIDRLLGSEWARQLYAHPLIESTSKSGAAAAQGRDGPSYIPSRSFANVLMEIVRHNTAGMARCKAALQSLIDAASAPDATVESLAKQVAAAVAELRSLGPLGQAIAQDLARRHAAASGSATYTVADAQADIVRFIDAISSGYVRQMIEEFPDQRLRKLLLTLFDDAKNDVDKFKENIEAWFNNGMDRVNGWYKRKSQWVVAGLALGIAVLMNVDAILIFKHLQANPGAREAMVNQARAYTEARQREEAAPTSANAGTVTGGDRTSGAIPLPAGAGFKDGTQVRITSSDATVRILTPVVTVGPETRSVEFKADTEFIDKPATASISARTGGKPIEGAVFQLELKPSLPAQFRSLQANAYALAIPIGWVATGTSQEVRNGQILPTSGGEYRDRFLQHVLGWLLTALAATLGAPFWFDTLNRIISIRSSGKAPEERPRPPKEVSVPVEPGQSQREADQLSRRAS